MQAAETRTCELRSASDKPTRDTEAEVPATLPRKKWRADAREARCPGVVRRRRKRTGLRGGTLGPEETAALLVVPDVAEPGGGQCLELSQYSWPA